MAIHHKTLKWNDVIFTHVSDGVETNFAITRMREHRLVLKQQVIAIPVEDEFALFCLTHRGIEEHRLLPLVQVAMQGDFDEPLIMAHHPADDSHLMLDGHHRFVAAAMSKRLWIKARILPERVWRKFIVTGLPSETDMERLVRSFSGLPATDHWRKP